MERDLQQICALENVGGAFVCDNAGELVVSSSPPVLATIAMGEMSRAAAQTLAAMDRSRKPVDRGEFTYDTWRLFVRDLGPAMILVVCHPNVDMATLRMTVDMTIVRWRKDNNIQKRLSKRADLARKDLLTEAHMDDVAWHSYQLLGA